LGVERQTDPDLPDEVPGRDLQALFGIVPEKERSGSDALTPEQQFAKAERDSRVERAADNAREAATRLAELQRRRS
jgi:hypothetical protein